MAYAFGMREHLQALTPPPRAPSIGGKLLLAMALRHFVYVERRGPTTLS